MATIQERLEEERQRRAAEGDAGGDTFADVREQRLSTFPANRPEDPSIQADPQAPLRERLAAEQRMRMSGQGVLSTTEDLMRDERNAFLGQQVGQVSVGEPGLRDFGLRFDLGLSNRFAEQRDKFQRRFPRGEFVEVAEPPVALPTGGTRPGGSTILVRRHENEDYFELDARTLDDFELLYDLADMSGAIPPIAGEILVTRGGSIIKGAIQAFFGAAGGLVAKEAVEELRGFNRDSPLEVAGSAALEGGLGAGGALIFGGAVEGPINAFRGASNIGLREGVREAQQAAGRVGVGSLTVDQVAASPILRLVGRQSAATVDTIPARIREQNRQALEALLRLSDENVARLFTGEIGALHDDAIRQTLNAVRGSRTPLSQGGTAVQAGIKEYEDLSSALVGRAYQAARQVEEPEFDLAPLLSIADDLERGILGRARDGSTVRLDEALDPDVANVISRIRALDPNLPTVDGVSATEQLRALRTSLWELSQRGFAAGRDERVISGQAGALYRGLTRVLRNPRNANEDFIRAWADADAEAARRFATLERIVVMNAARTETPAQLAARLARPLQVDNLVVLRDMLPANRWEDFRSSFKTNLIDHADTRPMAARLNEFDRETLDILLTPDEQQAFRFAAAELDRLGSSQVQAAIAQQRLPTEQARRLFRGRADSRNVGELVARINNGPAPARRAARAALMESIIEDVVTVVSSGSSRGARVVDADALARVRSDLQSSGAWNLLTPDDRLVLGDLETVMRYIPHSADAGTSIQAAETAAGLRGLQASAMVTLLEVMGTGRLFTNPAVVRLLVGRGTPPSDVRVFRVMGAAAATAANDAMSAQPADEGFDIRYPDP